MIEFILSKVVLISAGLVLIAMACSVFAQLDAGIVDHAAVKEAEGVADLLFQMDSALPTSRCRLVIGDLDLPSNSQVELANGSVWVRWPGGVVAAEGPRNLVIDGQSQMVLHEDDVLVVESIFLDGKKCLLLQSEKVDAISCIASTNLLHSSMEL